MEAYYVHHMQNQVVRVSEFFQNMAGYRRGYMLVSKIRVISPVRLPDLAERLARVMKQGGQLHFQQVFPFVKSIDIFHHGLSMLGQRFGMIGILLVITQHYVEIRGTPQIGKQLVMARFSRKQLFQPSPLQPGFRGRTNEVQLVETFG
ncbi:hypothetical protein D1872_235780 [compost metagenome]